MKFVSFLFQGRSHSCSFQSQSQFSVSVSVFSLQYYHLVNISRYYFIRFQLCALASLRENFSWLLVRHSIQFTVFSIQSQSRFSVSVAVFSLQLQYSVCSRSIQLAVTGIVTFSFNFAPLRLCEKFFMNLSGTQYSVYSFQSQSQSQFSVSVAVFSLQSQYSVCSRSIQLAVTGIVTFSFNFCALASLRENLNQINIPYKKSY